jgi:hypothetical protein
VEAMLRVYGHADLAAQAEIDALYAVPEAGRAARSLPQNGDEAGHAPRVGEEVEA